MIERRVLVVFKKEADAGLVSNFYKGLELLVQQARGLCSFEIRQFQALANEQALTKHVENVLFPDVMTVWKFENEHYLNEFITGQFHLDIARENFKPVVERRIVFNSAA